MDQNKYIELYFSEGLEHLSTLTRGLAPDDGLTKESVSELFRSAHSLKGMAAAMGFDSTSRLAHGLENILGAWRGGAVPSGEEREMALRATDLLHRLFELVRSSGTIPGWKKRFRRGFRRTAAQKVFLLRGKLPSRRRSLSLPLPRRRRSRAP